MSKLVIVAQVMAKAEKLELVKSELLKLIEPTRLEEGCITYQLHQDNANPNFFLFYEVWENRELWQVHMNNENLAQYVKATEGAIESFVVNEMSMV